MPNPKKVQEVAELKESVDKAQVMILADYRGLSVAEISKLRSELWEKNSVFKVVKNRLFKRALSDTQLEAIDSLLKGPTSVAIAFDDPVSLAKALGEYAKQNEKLQLKGGLFGESMLDLQGIESLSKMPGLTELRGQLAVSMKQPMTEVATMMSEPAKKMATATNQMLTKLVNAFQNRAQQLS